MNNNESGEKSPFCTHACSIAGIRKRDWVEWLLLVAFFLITGTVGHDPWGKKSEAYLFGIIYDFYNAHTWLIPTDAGMPFMEKPPLYAWTAVVLCNLFSAALPLHDAARLASALYMGITSIFLWKTARVIFEKRAERESLAWIGVALFLGTYGIAHWAHELINDVPLLTGATITIYGMALLCIKPQSWKRAGLWLGIGVGMAFMSKGILMPAVLITSGFILWCILPQLHQRATAKGIVLAVAVASPLCLIWPALVYHASSTLFMEWFWDNNIGRFLGFSTAALGAENDREHLLSLLSVFAFPIFPLACFKLFFARKEWRKPEYALPSVIAFTGFFTLFVSASFRAPYILPLLPCFALLGAPVLLHISSRFLSVWNVLARIAFSGSALGLWLIWWNLRYPAGNRPFPWLARWFDAVYPVDIVIHGPQTVACAVAIVAALFWLVSFRLRGNNALNTARIWFAGATLIWCTVYTLLLPWINETRSFRTTVTEMRDFISHSAYSKSCIADYNLGENMAPMVEYFMGLTTPLPRASFDESPCDLIVTLAEGSTTSQMNPQWDMIWRGSRLRDIKNFELRLYARKTHAH